ncbi:MAG: hypothetical protein LBB11_03485 [Puniceicoccales bacterium]|jgi:hypothetical protein|nr:hypothetical protein [Puniceicoccales bacterium]
MKLNLNYANFTTLNGSIPLENNAKIEPKKPDELSLKNKQAIRPTLTALAWRAFSNLSIAFLEIFTAEPGILKKFFAVMTIKISPKVYCV